MATSRINLNEWGANCYSGKPPPTKWLIDGTIPLGVPAMFAAQGDTGKSMLALKLALVVAGCGNPDEHVLGGPVCVEGTAVIITAEDGKDEIHRRLQLLDPTQEWLKNPMRLRIVPLPDAGGPISLVSGGDVYEGLSKTQEFTELEQQLAEIKDLRLVVFDPLQAFVSADINADPAAGQYACSLFGTLAARTGATVLVTHHMRKSKEPVKSSDMAREAIRGTTALVDGMRCVYALWPSPEKKVQDTCEKLGIPYARNTVVEGAIVKANGPETRRTHTYVRNETGLLVDLTLDVQSAFPEKEDLKTDLVGAVADASDRGYPFTKTGTSSGVYARRSELPASFHGLGRDRLRNLVEELLVEQRIVHCVAKGAKAAQWLDVPNGPFASGKGEFREGSTNSKAKAA